MKKLTRFKKRASDRSGFNYYERELVRDKSFLVGGEEFDTPPPSKKSLGGEGDLSGETRPNSDFATSGTANILQVNDHPTYFITASVGINTNFDHPYMRVAGSNTVINITADPQFTAGREGNLLTIFCVGSDITLDHGTGLNMLQSNGYTMTSGSISTFYYTSGGSVWNEVSRLAQGGFGG